jgi:hypothetical protein
MKPLIYLLNTGLLALVLHPILCLFYYDDVNWTGFLLFVAVLGLTFSVLLAFLAGLLNTFRMDEGGRLAAWLLGIGWAVLLGVFLIVKIKGWGAFTEAFLFSLPSMAALWISVLVRYPQFRKLVNGFTRAAY